MVEAWTCYIILSEYVVPHKGRSRVNVYAHIYMYMYCTYMYIHCTYYTYNVCVSSIHSLIVCYLLHTHTQLLIDPLFPQAIVSPVYVIARMLHAEHHSNTCMCPCTCVYNCTVCTHLCIQMSARHQHCHRETPSEHLHV